jgi:CubicO group peptidase (beta-lactamase class C family)
LIALPGCSETTAPITRPPGLEVFDSLIVNFMEATGIEAAALGIMRDGEVVYQKGFGWQDAAHQVPLASDAMMRLASVSKPITAAAVRQLIDDGMFTLSDAVFDVGQPDGGLLGLVPFPVLGDDRLGDVTVRHLLQPEGGWDRDVAGDLTYREITIASVMSVSSPPGRLNTLRYILGQPLQFTPGTRDEYSNIGYMVLGLIVEEVTGRDYLSYVYETVFEPLGVPHEDIVQGRTFPADRDPREPWYDDDSMAPNVFDPEGSTVRRPDGGWDHEARIAQGGLVASTRTILEFLEVFQVAGDAIGTRRTGSESSGWRWNHTGSLPGTNTLARQRGDGINYVVLFNKRATSGDSYSTQMRTEMDAILDAGTVQWPG